MLIALTLAAFVAGVAGAWSPCGFSMVDTLAPHGYAGRMRVTVVSCAAFATGALAGAVATFGGLALLGSALGMGGGAAVAVAAAALFVAAAGDTAGRRIVPQVRRQVPESWRRILPLPLAAALYGVLLGLGFTTFVLSFAVYALAAVCLALGAPVVGLAVGLAFAAGRILPVVVLAPMQASERGVQLAGAMGQRPGVLHALRAAGAVALTAAAFALALGGAPAAAAEPKLASRLGTDPSVGGRALAWQRPGGGSGILKRIGVAAQQLPGSDTALGPRSVVWREGDELVVAALDSLAQTLRVAAPGAEEPAVSDRWLVWRAREGDDVVLRAIDLSAPAQPTQELLRAPASGELGRPSLDGDRAVLHVATPRTSQIKEITLPARRVRVLRREKGGPLLLNPSGLGGKLLYIRSSLRGQKVLLGPRRGGSPRADKLLYVARPPIRRDSGHERGRGRHGQGYPGGRPPRLAPRSPEGVRITLWTTALARRSAYVTRIRHTGRGVSTQILKLRRR